MTKKIDRVIANAQQGKLSARNFRRWSNRITERLQEFEAAEEIENWEVAYDLLKGISECRGAPKAHGVERSAQTK